MARPASRAGGRNRPGRTHGRRRAQRSTQGARTTNIEVPTPVTSGRSARRTTQMAESRICPECNAPIPPDAPPGVCPYCAMRAGLHWENATRPNDRSDSRTPLPPEELGRLLPELEDFELIGPGGMGTAYKATHRGLDRPVAVKVLHAHLQKDPSFEERFVREAQTMARLDHPNIVRVYDFGHREGINYLVMEFVEGVTLRQTLAAGGLSPTEALVMVPRICEALQYAHDQGCRAPGHQAREHPARSIGRTEDRRLRPRPPHGPVYRDPPDADRASHGDAAVHGARANRAPGRRGSSRRHLFARRHLLRDADRRAAGRSFSRAVAEGRGRRPTRSCCLANARKRTAPPVPAGQRTEQRGRVAVRSRLGARPGTTTRPAARTLQVRVPLEADHLGPAAHSHRLWR